MTILVGTEAGLYAVDEAARPAGLEGRSVTALDPGGTWALVDGTDLERLDPDGVWRPVTHLPEGYVGRSLLAFEHEVLVGTAEAHLLRVAWAEVRPVGGFEAVDGRDAWYTPWGGPPDTRSLSHAGDGTLYANVHVGGIARSTDGGDSWRPTIDVEADVHQVLAHPELPGHVVAATAYGLAVSADHGETWATRADGLDGAYQRAVAVAGEWVLVSASEGPAGRRSAIYRAPFADGPFERCADPPEFGENVDSGWLVADGEAVAFAGPDGSVWRSEDAGASWARAAEGLPAVRSVALV